MMDVEMRIEGLDPLLAKMRAVDRGVRQKAARAALGKAARIVREKAKANALRVDDPETGRRIADNIVQRVRSRYQRRTGDIMISVGVGTEKGRIPKGNPDTGPRGNTPHWHLIEQGTRSTKAQPFLRPALQSSTQQAINVFVADMDKRLDKLLAQK